LSDRRNRATETNDGWKYTASVERRTEQNHAEECGDPRGVKIKFRRERKGWIIVLWAASRSTRFDQDGARQDPRSSDWLLGCLHDLCEAHRNIGAA